MTSSLVGSEMCIRDRPSDGGSDGSNANALGSDAASHSSDVPEELFITVSYTHLTLPTICSV
eukprot:4742809-Prorocentrum_lima.AAC.1